MDSMPWLNAGAASASSPGRAGFNPLQQNPSGARGILGMTASTSVPFVGGGGGVPASASPSRAAVPLSFGRHGAAPTSASSLYGAAPAAAASSATARSSVLPPPSSYHLSASSSSAGNSASNSPSPTRSSVSFQAANVAMQSYAQQQEGGSGSRNSSPYAYGAQSSTIRRVENQSLLQQYQNQHSSPIGVGSAAGRASGSTSRDGVVFSPYDRREERDESYTTRHHAAHSGSGGNTGHRPLQHQPQPSQQAPQFRDPVVTAAVEPATFRLRTAGEARLHGNIGAALPESQYFSTSSASRSPPSASGGGRSPSMAQQLFDPRALSLSAARLAVATAQHEAAARPGTPTSSSSSSGTSPQRQQHYYESGIAGTPPRDARDFGAALQYRSASVPMPDSVETPPRPPMPSFTEAQLRRQGFNDADVAAIGRLQRDISRGHEALSRSAMHTEEVVLSLNRDLDAVSAISASLSQDLEAFKAQMAKLSPLRDPRSQVSLPPRDWMPSAEDIAAAGSRSGSVLSIAQQLRGAEPSVARQLQPPPPLANPLPPRF